ncbi:(+)-neomenthol dehydrogenase isoform X1 [Arachis duranensis]|uniref:(+)-neomenthol dehydrogenase isoform X1 n=1 Tax=Arachis duranensis TaxID=130453 RepID=A0A6P4BUK3_ARADU|nr:(+)-neomenthol dehydrogenase isoform X1 [Arachis duranensis]
MEQAPQRYAVVTGANKGIGIEIVRQLASNGVKVVLTSRDEKRGLHALETLKDLSHLVLFHHLDVADPASVDSLANFIKSEFGKLHILINNAGIGGLVIKDNDLVPQVLFKSRELSDDVIEKAGIVQTFELAEECLQINYYGAKRTSEALLPLLQLSESPRIVNVSSSLGKLKCVSNEWAKGILGDAENLTEERVDEVLNEFLKDIKEGCLERKGWPKVLGAYIISKAAMNAYTRIVAKKYPTICINSVCPGYVKTDITANTGFLTAEEGAATVVKIALLSNASSGLFYSQNEVSSF